MTYREPDWRSLYDGLVRRLATLERELERRRREAPQPIWCPRCAQDFAIVPQGRRLVSAVYPSVVRFWRTQWRPACIENTCHHCHFVWNTYFDGAEGV